MTADIKQRFTISCQSGANRERIYILKADDLFDAIAKATQRYRTSFVCATTIIAKEVTI